MVAAPSLAQAPAAPAPPEIGEKAETGKKAKWRYVDPATLDYRAILPAPPADGSPMGRAQLALVAMSQRQATAAQRERAKREDAMEPGQLADVLGPGFTPERYPKTFELLMHVYKDTKRCSDAAKDVWNLPRPGASAGAAELGIKPLVEAKSGSYPSGHSTRGTVWGLVMAELVPAKAAELRERGRVFGFDRMAAGVHFPNDVAGGFVLGAAVFERLKQSDAFKADFAAAAAEWASAAIPAPTPAGQPKVAAAQAGASALPEPAEPLRAVSFMTGRWMAVNPNKTVNREHWMSPAGNSMNALFMQVRRDGGPAFFELSSIEVGPPGEGGAEPIVTLFFRHIHRRLAIDPKRANVDTFRLVKADGQSAVFAPTKKPEGEDAGIDSVTYRADGPDRLVQEIKYKPGSKEKDFQTVYTREP